MAASNRKRGIRWVLASLLVALIFLFVAVQAGQHVARTRAERLLADIKSLKLEKSSWSEAQAIMQRWGKWGHYDGSCDATHCEYTIGFSDWVGEFLEKLIDWNLYPNGLSRTVELAVSLLHAHLPVIEGNISVHNGAVVGTSFVIGTSRPSGGELRSRASGTHSPEKPDLWPEKDPHPEYSMRVRSGMNGYFFTEFNSAAKAEDIDWLTAFNFSCITRWVPCEEFGDLLPAAWARSVREGEHVPAIWERIADCTYSLEELARASEHVALVQVEKPTLQTRRFTSTARLIERLKGSETWSPNVSRDVWSDLVAPKEILLFAQDSNPIYPHNCGVIPATPKNLLAVKAALTVPGS